ncbi:MAG: tRNA (guanosine(37)-N1)-methyltransferase TrmD [Bacteroidota bacterium]|nr:tRNA (guanosine(37)-N1)-methyltransferase TrmD [Bacteroidota bacterium]
MLEIDILAVVPGLLEGPFSHSILARAAEKQLLRVRVFDLRALGIGGYNQIDDYAFGGGAGMVLMAQPLSEAIRSLQNEGTYDEIIYLTPDGTTLNQSIANQLSMKSRLLFLCGHYKGIDDRIRERFVTKEISIGDYVLSGGELAAAVLTDAIGRLIPGVLNDETSALTDSFQDGLLAPPVYTRPAEWEGMKVPDILLSGHQAKIEDWRYQQSIDRTLSRRPDLLKDEDPG